MRAVPNLFLPLEGCLDVLDLLAREGMIAADSVPSLRAVGGPAIAAAFDAGLVADDMIADLVAREAGTVVIDLERGTLEPGAVHLLSEEIARRHLAIVMAVEPSGRSIRVAFANPLDERAIREVADATRRSIRALVGTVSGIRHALDREYSADSSAKQFAGPVPIDGEIATESTRRVTNSGRHGGSDPASDASRGPRTLPAHRLYQEASLEQRHEALLLALIEKGVLTRGEYNDALKRLLGGR